MRRRELLALGGIALTMPFSAHAQQAGRVYRIGFLRVGEPPPSFIDPFRQGLRSLGYVDGQNLIIDLGLATSTEHLPEIARALVERNVDLIVASGTPAVLPARDAANGRPVIFVAGIDPVVTGLARGLAQPGGNLTGVTTVQIDLTAKRMQLIKEVLSQPLTLVAFLWRESNPAGAEYVREAEQAAHVLGVGLQPIRADSPSELEAAFREARALGAEAVVPMDDAVYTAGRRKLIEFAERFELPGVYPVREFVIDGGLISLGPKYEEVYRRAASFVDKVLRGTKPADLPVEQPTTFEVVLNLKAARKLRLTIPPMLLARADEVIE
jgi:putative ABC transport system substrate-binding protein